MVQIGISPGDRIYAVASRIPELYIAALGTLKAKGVFSALFASFGPEPLRLRVNAGRPKVLITTDSPYRRRIAPMRSGGIGKPDPVFGEIVKAFISLRPGHLATEILAEELLRHTRIRLGPTLAPREIACSAELPKTRSGKIMRRVLKSRELGLLKAELSLTASPRTGHYIIWYP